MKLCHPFEDDFFCELGKGLGTCPLMRVRIRHIPPCLCLCVCVCVFVCLFVCLFVCSFGYVYVRICALEADGGSETSGKKKAPLISVHIPLLVLAAEDKGPRTRSRCFTPCVRVC